MQETIPANTVPVNWGKLLENQLKKWQGGGHHPRGIAEYISNSDDSYRRQKKYKNQLIEVELHTRTGKKIDKLVIIDNAEGMSFDELENKFFQYFESFSGREKGASVTGKFGTGGKAYAIMNFHHCWIKSIQNSQECCAWFKWDSNQKSIIKGYDHGGYKNKNTNKKNGTIITLESSLKVNHNVKDIILQLEKLPRIRHVLKSQNIYFYIIRKKGKEKINLKYTGPSEDLISKDWKFPLPINLKNENMFDNNLYLRYYEKPLKEDAFIDLSDGISSVADLTISTFDNRPSSNYINGDIVINKLFDSPAVKENRRGLEEGDDLTEEINKFIKECIWQAINEVEDLQKQLDKQRRLESANKKLKELSKFLSKQDLKFKIELKELKKRFSKMDEFPSAEEKGDDETNEENQAIYRKPLQDDPEEILIKGKWIIQTEEGGDGTGSTKETSHFIPEENGSDFAVKVGSRRRIFSKEKKQKKGIQVLMSNDPDNSESPTFSKYDDPVSDRDLETQGIIWINSVHPIILKYGQDKKNDAARNENIANYTLLIIAQYYAQKEIELQPEEDRDDILLLFRKHFFILQREIREDNDINFFEEKA